HRAGQVGLVGEPEIGGEPAEARSALLDAVQRAPGPYLVAVARHREPSTRPETRLNRYGETPSARASGTSPAAAGSPATIASRAASTIAASRRPGRVWPAGHGRARRLPTSASR